MSHYPFIGTVPLPDPDMYRSTADSPYLHISTSFWDNGSGSASASEWKAVSGSASKRNAGSAYAPNWKPDPDPYQSKTPHRTLFRISNYNFFPYQFHPGSAPGFALGTASSRSAMPCIPVSKTMYFQEVYTVRVQPEERGSAILTNVRYELVWVHVDPPITRLQIRQLQDLSLTSYSPPSPIPLTWIGTGELMQPDRQVELTVPLASAIHNTPPPLSPGLELVSWGSQTGRLSWPFPLLQLSTTPLHPSHLDWNWWAEVARQAGWADRSASFSYPQHPSTPLTWTGTGELRQPDRQVELTVPLASAIHNTPPPLSPGLELVSWGSQTGRLSWPFP